MDNDVTYCRGPGTVFRSCAKMGKKIEVTIWDIGFRDITPVMENQMGKRMEHDMETEESPSAALSI